MENLKIESSPSPRVPFKTRLESTLFYYRTGWTCVIFNVAKGLKTDQVFRIWECSHIEASFAF